MLRSEAVVIDLHGDCISDRHTIHMDNWYLPPNLFLALGSAGSNAVRTVRTNGEENMPKEFKALKLKKGECKTSFSHGTMAMQWKDRKPVTTLQLATEKQTS